MEESKKRKPNIAKEKWLEIRALYEGTDTTLKVLAAKFGTSQTSICRKAYRDEWHRPKTRKEVFEEARRTAIEKKVEDQALLSTAHSTAYVKEQTKNFALAKKTLMRQLNTYDIISYIDNIKTVATYKKASGALLSGDLEVADEILKECKINKEAPYKIKVIIDGLCSLDIAERRLLGLDNIANPDNYTDDPMLVWVDDIEKARKKYLQVFEEKEKEKEEVK